MKDRLYSNKRLLEKGSPFSEILQGMVDTVLDAEIEGFMDEERASGKANKRNGRTKKQVLSELGSLDISTPRDRNGDFEPELVGKRQRELSVAFPFFGQVLIRKLSFSSRESVN